MNPSIRNNYDGEVIAASVSRIGPSERSETHAEASIDGRTTSASISNDESTTLSGSVGPKAAKATATNKKSTGHKKSQKTKKATPERIVMTRRPSQASGQFTLQTSRASSSSSLSSYNIRPTRRGSNTSHHTNAISDSMNSSIKSNISLSNDHNNSIENNNNTNVHSSSTNANKSDSSLDFSMGPLPRKKRIKSDSQVTYNPWPVDPFSNGNTSSTSMSNQSSYSHGTSILSSSINSSNSSSNNSYNNSARNGNETTIRNVNNRRSTNPRRACLMSRLLVEMYAIEQDCFCSSDDDDDNEDDV